MICFLSSLCFSYGFSILLSFFIKNRLKYSINNEAFLEIKFKTIKL